jgi:hypothetical protein
MVGPGAARAAVDKMGEASLNDGYSLFYDFCSQESQLSLLRWFKTMPPGISEYAKQISSTATADIATLKAMGAGDSSLKLDKISLPSFEIRVRQSMADDRKQQLIWGTSGAAFAQAMTMTQSEVTNYGMHVAKVLSETEPDPVRARALRRMYAHWSALHAEASRLNR